VGPSLFAQNALVYLMYVSVPLVWFLLFKTRWGLRVRAVGEHPRDVADKAMAGIVPGGLTQPQLLGLPDEGVLAVADPVRPGQQVLTLPPSGRLVLGEATDHVDAVHRVAAQGGAHLGDDGAMTAGDDLVLLAGRWDAHASGL